MDNATQVITILGVLLGGMTSYVATAAAERSRYRRELATRWDQRRIDAYLAYVTAVRSQVVAQRTLYEVRHGHRDLEREEGDLAREVISRIADRGAAFERVMLLGQPAVVGAAHRLNRDVIATEWRAMGQTSGAPEEWTALNDAAFDALNAFHDAARRDLGVAGSLVLPPP